MCGIVGIFGRPDRKLVRRMADILEHRGPDDEGYFFDSDIGLGMKRLSIIDLKTGKQPIIRGDMVIVYNGEVYNHQEIREELEKLGIIFKTKSDTEVLLAAVEHWGYEAVKRFNGMFAIAIWHKRKRELFLARDRLGIKPLYYHEDGNLVFASEIKALLASPGVKREPDLRTLVDYLSFQNTMGEGTFFKGVKRLLPGHWLVINKKGSEVVKYWEADFTKRDISTRDAVKGYERIMRDSVKRHMISDVPLGCYLSGGIDSGGVTAVAASLTGRRIRSFTGSFDEGPKYTELPAARAVADKVDARRHEVTIRAEDFIPSMPDIVYALDEPSTGCVCFPAFHVSRLVSKSVKVVLTGHGGDELFAGYPAFKGVYFRELIKRNPFNIFRILFGLKAGELMRVLYFLIYPIIQPSVRHGIYIMSSKRELTRMLTPKTLREIGSYDPTAHIRKVVGKSSGTEATERLYVKTYLPSLFVIEDKIGMANSIEARTPLCDNELVDFALGIPIERKLHRNTLKHIPKEALRKKLPGMLYEQPKKGFPTPLVPWFRGPLKRHIYDVLTGERAKNRGIFDTGYLKSFLDSFSRRKTDTLYDYAMANKIFSLYTIELWFRIFMDPEKVEKPGKDFF